MQQAIAEKKRQQRSRLAVDKILELRATQPPHWLPEVIAVITRIRPNLAEQAIDYLAAMDIRTEHETDVLKIATQLLRQLNHHLFHTYYHAANFPRRRFSNV